MVPSAREEAAQLETRGREGAPLISIGMPAFNCEKTLALAIRSILNQTYRNWEVVVIDDGSTDKTIEVGRSFKDPRVRIIADGQHLGIPKRRNQTIVMSRGDYFALLDGDDVSYPDRLERQVGYLQQHPEIDLLGCGMLVFGRNGLAAGQRPVPEAHKDICRRPSDGFHIAHATLMGRTSWFRAHPYDANAVLAEDQVLLLRSYSTSRFACLPEILYAYREELALGKILRARSIFGRAVFREFMQREKYLTAARGFLKQVAKAMVDILAIQTGLDYVLLGHRARPLSAADRRRWAEVWSQVQDAPCTELPAHAALEF